jgi:cell division protein FtsZ
VARLDRPRGGFDPSRLGEPGRPTPIVQKIVDAPLTSEAAGFTEVKIVGIGGGGGNALNRMVEVGVQGVEFIAVNTDGQALAASHALRKLQIGGRAGRGLGAGGDPRAGTNAAEMSRDRLEEALEDADMVFITAGLGGGTGTGAAPIVAECARATGALTVGVVTLPFGFEGYRRQKVAEDGVARLRDSVDALIVIPNDRLLRLGDAQMTVVEAFRLADDVLRQGVQGISDLVTQTGVINLDFADVKSVMSDAGTALMAIGEAQGEDRALQAARAAITSPLLDVSIEGAKGVLINVSGGADLTLQEVTDAANAVGEAVDPAANFIFGAVLHPRPQPTLKVTVIATGLRFAGDASRSSGRARGLRGGSSTPEPPPGEPLGPPRRRPAPSQPGGGDDDLDLPAFLRRRR